MVLKTAGELEMMDEANRIVHRVLDGVADMIRPGVTTRELDLWAEREIRAAGAVPAFLNYRGYPATLCTSVNDVIVHGIPGETSLSEGDIVGVDCGVVYNGYYGDAARTFAIGKVGDQAQLLLDVTRDALQLAIAQVRPGGRLSDIGRPCSSTWRSMASRWCGVRGHGIGTSLHEEPQVRTSAKPAGE